MGILRGWPLESAGKIDLFCTPDLTFTGTLRSRHIGGYGRLRAHSHHRVLELTE